MFDWFDTKECVTKLTHHLILGVYVIGKLFFILFVGWYGIRFIRAQIPFFFGAKLSHHMQALLSHVVYYVGVSLCVITALQSIGFDLSAVLGAAGIVGIAVGFAAQTSVSNIISGIFLLFEQSFSIDDTITYEEVTGVVHSIDLFSIKIRTFDNQLVRIPNEVILKQKITNVTYFDTRRIEITVHIFEKQDIAATKEVIEKTIVQTGHILQVPKPAIVFKSVIQKKYTNEKSVVLGVRVWVKQQNAFKTAMSLTENLKNAFDQENIAATIE